MKNQSNYFGRTNNLTPVVVSEANDKDLGNVVNVRIKNYNRNTLFGAKEKEEREVAA